MSSSSLQHHHPEVIDLLDSSSSSSSEEEDDDEIRVVAIRRNNKDSTTNNRSNTANSRKAGGDAAVPPRQRKITDCLVENNNDNTKVRRCGVAMQSARHRGEGASRNPFRTTNDDVRRQTAAVPLDYAGRTIDNAIDILDSSCADESSVSSSSSSSGTSSSQDSTDGSNAIEHRNETSNLWPLVIDDDSSDDENNDERQSADQQSLVQDGKPAARSDMELSGDDDSRSSDSQNEPEQDIESPLDASTPADEMPHPNCLTNSELEAIAYSRAGDRKQSKQLRQIRKRLKDSLNTPAATRGGVGSSQTIAGQVSPLFPRQQSSDSAAPFARRIEDAVAEAPESKAAEKSNNDGAETPLHGESNKMGRLKDEMPSMSQSDKRPPAKAEAEETGDAMMHTFASVVGEINSPLASNSVQKGVKTRQSPSSVMNGEILKGNEMCFSRLFEFDNSGSKKKVKESKLPYDAPGFDQEPDIGFALNKIESLSRLVVHKGSGLPCWHFAIRAANDRLLFSFTVEPRKSMIPNSGYGLFLRLDQVLELRGSSRERWAALHQNFVYDTSTLGDPLGMVASNGIRSSLLAKGRFSRFRDDRMYAPATLNSQEIVRDGASKCCGNLSIVGDELHYNPGDEPVEGGIGFAGIFRKDVDYGQAIRREFPSDLGCINLGQYGPFRDDDRKEEPQFAVKNWILSYSPSEWPFDVEEPLFDQLQIVDITDDATGEPHNIAKSNVLMYVNEVGHSKLEQNVFIKQNECRSVDYYFRPRTPIKEGAWVELLTNYRDVYEIVRERHGYGWKNVNFGMPSDDCLASRLSRGFREREDVLIVLEEMSFVQLYATHEFVEEKMWAPIVQQIRCDEDKGKLHLSKLTRISWIRRKFKELFQKYSDEAIEDGFPVQSVALRSIEKCVRHQKVSDEVSALHSLSGNGDSDDYDVLEEFCFDTVDVEGQKRPTRFVSHRIVQPLDKSMWCPVAQNLTRKLCLILHSVGRDNFSAKKEFLYEEFMLCAKEAADLVRNPTSIEQFFFSSGLHAGFRFPGSLADCLVKLSDVGVCMHDHSTVPKGYLAALTEKRSYLEALAAASCESGHGCAMNGFDASQECLVTHNAAVTGKADPLAFVLRCSSAVARLKSKPHTLWYLVWQVIHIVHIFATAYIEDSIYNLEKLCSTIGVDLELVQCRLEAGIYIHPGRPFVKQTSSSRTRSKSEKKKKKSKHMGSLKNASGSPRKPAKEIWEGAPSEVIQGYPDWHRGWTKRTFERQSGATKGSTDDYWYTPENGFKLRSMTEIRRFLACLDLTGGNEADAFKMHKGK